MDPIVSEFKLGFPWKTPDPFLFCAYHDDAYPAGKDGWRMYHGEEVPGFPAHPHRGFETVTIARRGLIDHSDSLGAAARFGRGDVQWVTAGKGVVHSEMFPLLDPKGPNPLELFQIWLNLPKADKLADPKFVMLWSRDVPVHEAKDAQGRATHVTVVAGRLGDARTPAPPPNSWAARPEADVAIWTLRMDPGAEWTLPPAAKGSNRTVYFFRGKSLRVGSREVDVGTGLELRADFPAPLINGPEESELLLLQGKPIGEPVVQYGPFVMNTEQEIHQAFSDYRRTGFGGWPWESQAPVHPREETRFARHGKDRLERPG